MKAAVITSLQSPLEVQNLPDPQPGPKDALISVGGCGVCRSDWHLWQGHWSWIGVALELPRVIGHELGGTVEEVGKEVRGFKKGDRVTLPFHMACGECDLCYSGNSHLCLANGVIGAHFDGGYGSMAVVPAADVNLVHIPDEVDFLSAASLGCRYMTAYHGIVDRAKVQPGEWVAVYGIGGVGLSAVQIASAIGAQVVAVSRTKDKLDIATSEGAHATVQSGNSVDAAEAVKEVTGGGAHVSVDAYGSSQTTIQGIMSLRKGGRHLQLGMTGKEDQGQISMPVDMMTFFELSFIPSLGCPTSSYPGLVSLVANGKLNPKSLVSKTVTVDQVNDVLNDMTDFNTSGFNVIQHN